MPLPALDALSVSLDPVVLDHLYMTASGIALFIAVVAWRRAAFRWDTWFPLLKKLVRLGLYALTMSAAALAGHTVLTSTAAPWSLALAAAAGIALLPLMRSSKSSTPAEKTERGSRIESAKTVRAQVKREKEPADLALGGVPITHKAEPYHMLVAGSTGSGKSVAIRKLADTLRQRGDTVIMVDSGGEFIARYYNAETDHILNPFDDRCAAWSPTAELEGPWDAQALARSIIPDGHGDSREWNGYAQTFVTACLQKLWEQGRLSLHDFLYAVQAAPIAELETLLAGTPAAAQLASERTFGSIRTIASNYLLPYSYLSDTEAGTKEFSVARFVREAQPGFLFLSYRDDQLDSLRQLLACALDIAARTILSMKPDPDRRVWFIIDEFASIGKVQSIEAVATKARKNGGCLVIGLQSVSQLRDRYGDHAAQSILSCLSTWLVLRCTDAETAEYMSAYLGDAQVVRAASTSSTNDVGESRSVSEQMTTERVVMASEIQALANLHGFLKLAGAYPVCSVELDLPAKSTNQAADFVARDFKARPMTTLKQAPAKAAPAQVARPSLAPSPVSHLVPSAAISHPVRAPLTPMSAASPVPANPFPADTRPTKVAASTPRQALRPIKPVPVAASRPAGPLQTAVPSLTETASGPQPVPAWTATAASADKAPQEPAPRQPATKAVVAAPGLRSAPSKETAKSTSSAAPGRGVSLAKRRSEQSR